MAECSRRFLRRHGLATEGKTRVSEYAIKPGASLLVLGTLGDHPGAENISTRPQRGYLSREAADLQRREQLEAMGVPSSEIPAMYQDNVPEFNLNPRVVLRAGDSGLPFVLSRQTPQRMIDNLARRSTFSIWGGPPLALLSLGLLMKFLGLW
jgi:hypothetical protein